MKIILMDEYIPTLRISKFIININMINSKVLKHSEYSLGVGIYSSIKIEFFISLSLLGFLVSGSSVQSASVLLSEKTRSRKAIEEKLLKLKEDIEKINKARVTEKK